jgi:hypothetical protein
VCGGWGVGEGRRARSRVCLLPARVLGLLATPYIRGGPGPGPGKRRGAIFHRAFDALAGGATALRGAQITAPSGRRRRMGGGEMLLDFYFIIFGGSNCGGVLLYLLFDSMMPPVD